VAHGKKSEYTKFELSGVYLTKMNALQKFTIVGFLIVFLVACLLLHWRHVTMARFDRDFRQNLAGTWLREEDNLPHEVGMPQSMRCTNTVTADGSFIELSWFSHPDRTNTYRRTGTWLVKNGHLIQTLKTSTNPTEVTPWSDTGRIVRADTGEFTVRWKSDETWQRVTR
jgi:hypothetical protein